MKARNMAWSVLCVYVGAVIEGVASHVKLMPLSLLYEMAASLVVLFICLLYADWRERKDK